MQKEAFRFYLPLFETTFLERIALRLIRRKMRGKKRYAHYLCAFVPQWTPGLKEKIEASIKPQYTLFGYLINTVPADHHQRLQSMFVGNVGERELRAVWIDELLAYHDRMKDASGVL